MKVKNKICSAVFTLILAFLFVSKTFAQTYISGGNISGNWTYTNSPYVISGDIVVPSDSSLIIQAGVEVKFDGFYRFIVNGTLTAIGEENNKIMFTSNLTEPSPGDWYNIILSSSSIMKYCIIEYAGQPDPAINRVAVRLEGNAVFTYNIVRNNLVSGVGAWMGSPIISHNIIHNNSTNFRLGAGIYTQWSSATICNNTIVDNAFSGMLLDANAGSLNVFNNIVTNNNEGIHYNVIVESPLPLMDYNNVWNNTQDYVNINAGQNSISADPLFVGDGSFHLTEISPCIDAGNPESALDPDSTIADLGARFFKQQSATGITVVNNNLITIYPNPADNLLNISGLQAESKIEIYSLSGKLVLKQTNSSNPVKISGLANGTYILKAFNGNELMISQKFVKN